MQTFWIIVTALAFNAAGLTAMFFYFRRLIRRTLELDEVLDRARDEIGGMIAELNQTTDRNVSLLEDRIAAASSAVDAAEKRFGALSIQAGNRGREREMFDRLSRAGSAMAVQRRTRDPGEDGTTLPPDAGTEPSSEQSDPRPALNPDATSKRAAATPLPQVKKTSAPIDTGLSAHDRVVRLWEQGFSSEIIAPKLGMTIAETDLIIAMEEQRRLLGR